ncbi:hypothetical protein CLV51_101803 [Chitinophaga niastensis]|uniref:Uncharacterized protein n=1 Tax=Chitinophaga niastensis TaxID=536980 RepID=A0A2P8HTB5_CHINA|nr:hypothetical protein [Chitinophaga niastensis]PSL49470.1 hypothetical protein CLV51_101803 [Chitinophaga niastensis]
MSTEKKDLGLTPLKENELGQIEGGFAEVDGVETASVDDTNFLCGINISKCGKTTTVPTTPAPTA